MPDQTAVAARRRTLLWVLGLAFVLRLVLAAATAPAPAAPSAAPSPRQPRPRRAAPAPERPAVRYAQITLAAVAAMALCAPLSQALLWFLY